MAPPMLASNQRSLWAMQELRGDNSSLNVAGVFTLAPEVDIPVLGAACRRVARMHPVLSRRVGLTDGGLIYERGALRAGVLDVVSVASADGRRRATAIGTALGRQFDLGNGPLWRMTLFAPGKSNASYPPVLALVLHHLIADFRSVDLLARQIELAYRDIRAGPAPTGVAPPTAIAAARNRDPQPVFLAQEGAYRSSPSYASDAAYWRKTLAVRPDPAAVQAGLSVANGTGYEIRKPMGPGLSGNLRAVARDLALTPFELLLAAHALHLAGGGHGCIGFTVDLRRGPSLRDSVGYFTTPVPVVIGLTGGETLAAALDRVGRQARMARLHGRFPLMDMQKLCSARHRETRLAPLFRCLFNFLKFDPDFGGKGGKWRLIRDIWTAKEPLPCATMYDLTLRVEDRTTGFAALWQFDEGVFDRSEMTAVTEDFERLLRALPTALEDSVDGWTRAACLPTPVIPAARDVARL